jgi:serine/threonine protein kinase/tetratricopeptide (TPR) repeat protein
MTEPRSDIHLSCPDEPTLSRFINDQLAPDDDARVGRHVESCSACQQRLDRPRRSEPIGGDLLLALRAGGRDELPPRLVGYRPLGRLGKGGMGVVWRVRDLEFGRDLALKVMKAALWGEADPEGRDANLRRFLEEAHVCGRLTHPSIVPVHMLGRLEDGRPYYLMRLVEGHTLATLLDGRTTPADRLMEWVQVFAQVSQAVGYAHSQGVIHRDLTPANVMVGEHGEVQVMDWGLAKALTGQSGSTEPTESENGRSDIRTMQDADLVTQAGSVLGTPAFMAPEQAGGEVGKIDERSDVFGLGAVLCAILTGKPPYSGPNKDAIRLMAVRGETGDAFARLDTCGADPELVALCKQCLASDREVRPRDAGAVAQAVATLRAAADERARRAEVDRVRADGDRQAAELTAAAERKRRRVQLVLAAAVGLLLFGGGAVAWWADKLAADSKAEIERIERERETRRTQNGDAVVALLAQGEQALRDDNAEKAGLVLKQAEERAADGGAEHLKERRDRGRTALEMLEELDRIENLSWTVINHTMTEERAAAELPKALRAFGIVPGAVQPNEAAQRVNAFPIRERLLMALDRWLVWHREDFAAALLRVVDPDPYRDQVREAILRGDTGALGRLAKEPDSLRQPARFAAVMGGLPVLPLDRRERILLHTIQRQPGVFSVLMTLARLYPEDQKGRATDRVRWYQAALTVQPKNYGARFHLAYALCDNGQLEEGIAAYEEVIRMDKNDIWPHNNLAWYLATGPDGVRDGRRAVKLATRACELSEWKEHTCVATLAAAYAEAGDFAKAVTYQMMAQFLKPPRSWKWHTAGALQRLSLYARKMPYRDPAPAPKGPAPPSREVKRP